MRGGLYPRGGRSLRTLLPDGGADARPKVEHRPRLEARRVSRHLRQGPEKAGVDQRLLRGQVRQRLALPVRNGMLVLNRGSLRRFRFPRRRCAMPHHMVSHPGRGRGRVRGRGGASQVTMRSPTLQSNGRKHGLRSHASGRTTSGTPRFRKKDDNATASLRRIGVGYSGPETGHACGVRPCYSQPRAEATGLDSATKGVCGGLRGSGNGKRNLRLASSFSMAAARLGGAETGPTPKYPRCRTPRVAVVSTARLAMATTAIVTVPLGC